VEESLHLSGNDPMRVKKHLLIRSSSLRIFLLTEGLLLLAVSVPSALGDVLHLARNGGMHAGAAFAKAGMVAPEPAMLALFGGGLISIALFFRRRLQRGNSAWSDRAQMEPQSNSSKLSFELPPSGKNF
jgi:hypothetical protein